MSRRIILVLFFSSTIATYGFAQSSSFLPTICHESRSWNQPIQFINWEADQPSVVNSLQPDPPGPGQSADVLDLQGQLDLAQDEITYLRQQLEVDSRTGNSQPQGDTPGPGGDMGDMATQSQNPVGGLWMMWLQNDMKLLEGPGDGKRIFNTTVFQPVMPVQLNDTWKLINRPVFMFNSFEVPNNFIFRPGGSQDPVFPPTDPFSTQAGLGDIAFIQWLSNSPSDSKMVTGFGWNWMFPAATHPTLGTGRTSLGPSIVAMYLGDRVIAGGIMQQYFSIDSRADRPRVSLMDLQYVFRYRLNPMFSVGFTPNIQWDQVTGQWTVPVGFGFDTMTMTANKKPIRWGAELQYFASHHGGPSRAFDPEWNFRLYVSPIIKAPKWATRGLFGNGCGCRCGRRHCRCR